MTRKPPFWLMNLKPGEYDVKAIRKKTGLATSTILQTLKRWDVEIRKVPSGYRNLSKNLIIWKGFDMQEYAKSLPIIKNSKKGEDTK